MSKMKAWQMDHDIHIADAIDHGASSVNEVTAYVKVMLKVIDKNYIEEQVSQIFCHNPATNEEWEEVLVED